MIKGRLVDICKRIFKKKNPNVVNWNESVLSSLHDLLHEKNGILDSVIENADGYVWCIDTERRYTAFNTMVSKAVKDAFGADIKLGDRAYEVLEAMDPSMKQEWETLYESGFRGKPQRLLHEFSFHGQPIFFDVRLNPVRKDNRIIGLSCFAKDITKQMLYNEQLQIAIAKATIETQEKERDELGKELHDNITQMLATSLLYLKHAGKFPARELTLVQKSMEIIHSSIEELRRLSGSLVLYSFDDKSLKEKIGDLITDIEFIKGKFIFHDLETLNEEVLSDLLKKSIFRIIQEQVNNIIKYADASKVNIIILQQDRVLELSIEDNGKGFDMKTKRKGIGITNIISRAQAQNGHVTIDTEPGKGCKLLIRFSL